MKLILASGSPRRKDLLTAVGVPIAGISPANIPEQREASESPLSYCIRLAIEKSKAQSFPNSIVLAADTIVCMQDSVFEKPRDDEHALSMLMSMQGEWHNVITAWAISNCETKELFHGHAISQVRFRILNEQECLAYIDTQEGKDKAGGYGIQGLGSALVATIKGSYSNIVGLPMEDVIPQLRKHIQF